MNWGRVADPEPRIISLLRTLRMRNDSAIPADELARTYADLDKIVADWLERESVTELRAALGVNQKKRRRTQLTVDREYAIANAIVNAALRGDRNPKKAAGDEMEADEREVQRAWKTWGQLQTGHLRHFAESRPQLADVAEALSILGGDKN